MRNFIREYSFCFFAGALTILFFLLRFCYAGFTGEENRYASVSWQMYQQGTWLIPHLGFDVYPDKPPLTYWLNILGWHVNAAWTWPLIIPAIFTIGNFFLTQKLAQLLYPDSRVVHCVAPMFLIGMPYFVMHLGLVRFDMQLTFFNLLACYSLFGIDARPRFKFVLFAIANTMGVLAKGPVIYLFTIPEVIAFGFAYRLLSKQFFLRYFFAITLSLLLCLLWVVPVFMQMGIDYAHQLIVEQVLMRLSGGHVGGAKPFWFYVPVICLMLFPWLLFSSFWKRGAAELKSANKFLLVAIVLPIIILSVVVSKQERYLLPLAPLLAVYIAARLFAGLSQKSAGGVVSSASLYWVGGLLFVFGLVVFFAVPYDAHLNVLYKLYFPAGIGLMVSAAGVVFFFLHKTSACCRIKWAAFLVFLSVAGLQLGYLYAVAQARNLFPIAQQLKKLQTNNVPVVSADALVNEMQYLGRLKYPVLVLNLTVFQHQWRLQNPNGWLLLSANKNIFSEVPQSCYRQNFHRMKREMLLCPAAEISPFCDGTRQSKCFLHK